MTQATVREVGDDFVDVVNFIAEGGTFAQLHNIGKREMEAVYAMAYNYYRQARWQEALKAFTFLVVHDQWERRFLIGRAACLQMLKQFETAFEVYSLAWTLDATDAETIMHMAECLIGMGKKAEAASMLEGAIAQTKNRPELAGLAVRAQAMAKLLIS